MKFRYRIFLSWLPFILTSTILCGLLYGAVQQSLRQSANDPQIQLAEDAAQSLAGGASAFALVGNIHTDISTSLAPFIVIYDNDGHVIASSGTLKGEVPVPPAGVFDYARSHPDNRLTWQPASNVRLAAVVKRFEGKDAKSSGYVVVARSLREVEVRENFTALACFGAWLACLVVTLIAIAYGFVMARRSGQEDLL